jgi:hypothetical protein
MRNPTVKQVDFVIKKLESVREQASEEGAFNINEGRVYNEIGNYECGTVHCVAGWYAFANLRRKEIKDRFKKGFVTFKDGVELMTEDLGFNIGCSLKDWAKDNPKIWGNEEGFEMFAKMSAYNKPGFDGVISQWELVKQNLIKLKMEKTK